MGQEDYLKRQIDQLGQVFARLLGIIFELKNQGKETEIVAIVDKTLNSELGLDLSKLITIPKDTFIETLTQNKEISKESLDKLADILLNIADREQGNVTKDIILERVLEIYKYLENNDKTYSFERYLKMEKIKKDISV
jgi:hypothetical protein